MDLFIDIFWDDVLLGWHKYVVQKGSIVFLFRKVPIDGTEIKWSVPFWKVYKVQISKGRYPCLV